MKSATATSKTRIADEIKEEISRRSAQHREQLEKEVEHMTKRTKEILTNALIIGGTLLAGYVIVRLVAASSQEEEQEIPDDSDQVRIDHNRSALKNKPPGIIAQFGSVLASQAATFIVQIAKDKLSDFFNGSNKNKDMK